MEMDPVVMLAEQLRETERTMPVSRDDAGGMNQMFTAAVLHRMIETTEPTSALGAGELLTIAAKRLASSTFHEVSRLLSAGERLTAGQRTLADILWLRAVAKIMESGSYGSQGRHAALLIRSAIKGATKPLVIFRTVAEEKPVECEVSCDLFPLPPGKEFS
jgi:hypothetical protein